MYGITLIVILVITGGVIAFIGDRLGSILGKKRLRIWGLRPRHTSIIMTIATGIFITAMTLGIMTIVSQDVRTALFGMYKLNSDMAEARKQLSTSEENLQNARQEQSLAEELLNKVKGELAKLNEQEKDLEEKNSALQKENDELELTKAELLLRNDDLVRSNEELVASQEELRHGNEILVGENNVLLGENKSLDEKNKNLGRDVRAMREGEITFLAGEVLYSDVLKGDRSVDEIKADLEAVVHKARQNAYLSLTKRLGGDVTEEDTQIWMYQPEYDEAIDTIAKSKDDIVVRITAAGNLVRGEGIKASIELYKDKLVYKDGETVLEKTINLDSNDLASREKVLIDFLNEINLTAINQGMLSDPISGSVGVISADQIYTTIQKLEPMTGFAVISAYAKGNTNVLGPLRIELKILNEK